MYYLPVNNCHEIKSTYLFILSIHDTHDVFIDIRQ